MSTCCIDSRNTRPLMNVSTVMAELCNNVCVCVGAVYLYVYVPVCVNVGGFISQ